MVQTISKLYDNYEVEFHNALWASSFMGSATTTMTWQWPVVHWWPDANPVPKQESQNMNPTNVEGATNTIAPVGGNPRIIKNHKMVHNYKPLYDFINYPFETIADGNFLPKKIFNTTTTDIECYYLVDDDNKNYAFGWVHNVDKYWENSYYGTKDPGQENYYGCNNLPSTQFTLEGFIPGETYNVVFARTRMDTYSLPANDNPVADVNGNLIISLSIPLACDTFVANHAPDYAFSITKQGAPIIPLRSMSDDANNKYDFDIFPNPTSGNCMVKPTIQLDCFVVNIYNALGQQVYSKEFNDTGALEIELKSFSRGIYSVQMVTNASIRSHNLILQ